MRGVTKLCGVSYSYLNISIHTPHARRDFKDYGNFTVKDTFQSTRLMRGVTNAVLKTSISIFISIHTPHARRDAVYYATPKWATNFNPHASCEA